jgi:hypothetical protein
VWIGERHYGIVCAFGQPLLCRYVVVRVRLWPVDMELRRFQRRYLRDLHCFTLCVDTDTNPNFDSDTWSCRRKLRHAAGRYGDLL